MAAAAGAAVRLLVASSTGWLAGYVLATVLYCWQRLGARLLLLGGATAVQATTTQASYEV